jgi:hypothetical protein
MPVGDQRVELLEAPGVVFLRRRIDREQPEASPTPSTLSPVSCWCTYPANVFRHATRATWGSSSRIAW